jgi:hypothetical protein
MGEAEEGDKPVVNWFRQRGCLTMPEDRDIAELRRLREQAESVLRERLVLLHLLRQALGQRRELLTQSEQALQELRSIGFMPRQI